MTQHAPPPAPPPPPSAAPPSAAPPRAAPPRAAPPRAAPPPESASPGGTTATAVRLFAGVVIEATTPAQLERCFAIRRAVFIEEQGVPEALELDDDDARALHLLALPHPHAPLAAALGTARLLPVSAELAKVQRVAVLFEARRGGVAAALMAHLEDAARARGHSALALGAQLSALGFYERLKWQAEGPVFLDAGIEHRLMRKSLARP